MGDMRKLEELIVREIDEEVAKGSLTPETMKTIACAVDTIMDIHKIEKMDMEMEEGYSGHYERGYNVMPFYYGSYGEDGESHARKRDAMGRYSRDMMVDRRGYSRDQGMSKVDQLQKMMDETTDPEEKETMRRLILHMENQR